MSANYENNCGWALDRVDPYIDGDLQRAELSRFESHVSRCETCARELALARRVLEDLRSLPHLEAPARVTDTAATAAGAMERERPRRRFADWLGALAPRPALAAMLLLVTAAAVFVISQQAGPDGAPGTSSGYTEAEIEEATEEALMALSYVGRYSRMPGEIIRQEVIEDRVVPAVRRGLEESLKQSGGSNDLESSERSSS